VQAAFAHSVFTQTFGAARVPEIPVVMASEDFAYYARKVPACFAFLGAGDASHAFPNHHPAFDIVEEALGTGIATHVALAEHALQAA
jgi:amidohydrolase